MKRSLNTIAAAALTAIVIGAPAYAQDVIPTAVPESAKVGTLTCDISAGLGLIVASQKQVACMFTPSEPGPREVYYGTINKFGLDIGGTVGGEMAWAVYAPTTRQFGALAGHYAGASAEATVGLGAGANALIGGSSRTITLQPISIQGQAGLNLAVGVASLDLHRAR
jgi:hypothetical protein